MQKKSIILHVICGILQRRSLQVILLVLRFFSCDVVAEMQAITNDRREITEMEWAEAVRFITGEEGEEEEAKKERPVVEEGPPTPAMQLISKHFRLLKLVLHDKRTGRKKEQPRPDPDPDGDGDGGDS